MRVKIVPVDAIPRDRFNPLWLDRAGAACEEARRLGQLGGEHPFRRFSRDARARMQMKTNTARAIVTPVLGLCSDVRQQSREQRLMNGGVAARVNGRRQARVPLPPCLGQLVRDLLVDVAPFASPGRSTARRVRSAR